MFYFFFFFFFLPSSKDPSVHVHAGRVIVTNYPNDDTIKISRGLRGTGVFSLSEQTVSLYDPSLCRAYPVHRAGPDHLSIPLSLTEPPPHPRRVIGTRPQPPPLFNTPAPAYSTPATGELPPYIHQRGCIQPPLTRPPVLLPPTSSSAPLPSSLSLSLSFSLSLFLLQLPVWCCCIVRHECSISLSRSLSLSLCVFACRALVPRQRQRCTPSDSSIEHVFVSPARSSPRNSDKDWPSPLARCADRS